MGLENIINETAKAGWLFLKSILLLGVPLIIINVLTGIIWSLMNFSGLDSTLTYQSGNIFFKISLSVLSYWPVFVPILLFVILMPLLYFKNAYGYGLKKVIAFVISHAKVPVCDYLGDLLVDFVRNNQTLMGSGENYGPDIKKSWKKFSSETRKVRSKPLKLAMNYILDKISIVDFFERIELDWFDIESTRSQNIIKDEINVVVQENVIDRFVEPDMSGFNKLMAVNVVLVIVFAVLCSYYA